MDKENLLKAFSDFLDNFGGSQEPSEPTVEVVKGVNNELMQATFVALAPEETDLHGDIYSAQEIAKGCHSFNTNCMQTNLGHLVMVGSDVCSVVESYIAPVDMQIDSTFVKKGTWLQVWQFTDGDTWEGVKKGTWNGISIGCLAEEDKDGN